jgi:hypothetical protein
MRLACREVVEMAWIFFGKGVEASDTLS